MRVAVEGRGGRAKIWSGRILNLEQAFAGVVAWMSLWGGGDARSGRRGVDFSFAFFVFFFFAFFFFFFFFSPICSVVIPSEERTRGNVLRENVPQSRIIRGRSESDDWDVDIRVGEGSPQSGAS